MLQLVPFYASVYLWILFLFLPYTAIFLPVGQVEEEIDREYGGLPKASVFLSGIASDPDRTSKFLGWNDLDQVIFYSYIL